MPRGLARSLLSLTARFVQDACGASGTIFAVTLPVLLGFETLSAETGFWYMLKWQNQSAADAAAISAAYEVIGGTTGSVGELTDAASEAAEQNGYRGAAPRITYPYSDDMVGYGIAATLQQTERRFVGSMFPPDVVTIAAKAVAVIQPLSSPCMLSLANTGAGVEVDDAVSLDLSDCSLAANSASSESIEIHSGVHSISAKILLTPGAISFNGSPIDPTAPPTKFVLALPPMIGAYHTKNPYAAILTHAFLSSGASGIPEPANTWIAVTETINPGLYEGGMSIAAGAVIDLMPGVYYATNGNFSVSSGAIVTCKTCDSVGGVTIVLTSSSAVAGTVGNAQISSGGAVRLQAPTDGPFSGFLFLQDPLAITTGGDIPDNALEGGPAMNLTGLVYFPATAVVFRGNPGATCTLLIARQITITGDTRLTTSGCTMAGLNRLPFIYTAALVE